MSYHITTEQFTELTELPARVAALEKQIKQLKGMIFKKKKQ